MIHRIVWQRGAIAAVFVLALAEGAQAAGQLELVVTDRDTGRPLACRVHLVNAAGRPVRPPGLPHGGDHFIVDGKATLRLPNGTYQFVMERGPEYLVRSGHFTIQNFANDTKEVDLKRFVDMAAEGWYSGDLDVHRSADQIELLMRADDLHLAPLITWTNGKNQWAGKPIPQPERLLARFDDNRLYRRMGGEDSRPGGVLRIFNLDRPLDLPAAKANWPSSLQLIAAARQAGDGWIDAGTPFSWDLPAWVAAGGVDSVQLVNRHLGRSTVIDNEAGGRPRDRFAFAAPHGNGRWSQEIYYHLLNCGFRIPPTAGSGSGVSPNPLGYDRVYVHCGDQLTWTDWWGNLRRGRVVVTNGPLLRPLVEGELPGHVFHARAGQTLDLEIGLTLSTRDKVAYLEVVKNGRVAAEVRLEDWKQAGGRLPLLKFDESGWFVVRAVTDERATYRYASSGPYYVQIGPRRISRASAQFFLDWASERLAAVQSSAGVNEQQLAPHRQSQDFWRGLVNEANAE